MAVVILPSSTVAVSLSTNDIFLLPDGNTIYSSGKGILLTDPSGMDVVVRGDIAGTTGIEAQTSTKRTAIVIGETGTITADKGIVSDRFASSITVEGEITAFQSAIILNAPTGQPLVFPSTVSVSGNISAIGNGIDSEQNATVIDVSGNISASGGIYVSGSNTLINNSGIISGNGFSLSGNDAGNAIYSIGSFDLVNSGILRGTAPHAVESNAETAEDSVLNTGLIDGGVSLGGGTDSLTNSGTIAGAVDMGAGADVVSNSGTITDGIQMGTGSTQVTNTRTGIVTGDITGTVAMVANDGRIDGSIDVAGSTAIVNSGIIFSASNGIVRSGSAVTRIVNTGTITSGGYAINSTGDDSQIINEGTVSGDFSGIYHDGLRSTISNSGSVYSQSSIALLLFSDRGRVVNTGHIESGRTTAVEMGVSNGSLGNTFINSGTVIGGAEFNTAFAGDAGDQIVSNTGLIVGDVVLSGGDDTYRGNFDGFVEGQVLGGDGEDTLRGGAGDDTLDGGNDNDELHGGSGEDMLSGGAGRDLLSGGADNDTLLGGGGGDTLTGGKGDDMLDGGNNDDRLSGGAGADDLLAGDGNDTLHGGDDNDTFVGGRGEDLMNGDDGDDLLSGEGDSDTINGGKGDDTITGGNGGDFLSGGTGEDVFVFSNASHIGTSAAERDVISDFMTGEDMLDFTGLGLSFSAAGAIGGGTASVWLESLSGTLGTVVKIDADGDGAMDGRIVLSQGATAVEGDLIL